MGAADNLERELPYLRRYARAVTGSGEGGDAIVEHALMSALEDGHRGLGRIELFARVETVIRNARTASDEADRDPASSEPRRALLLTAMEGFAQADAAQVMQCEPAEIEALIADAETQLTDSLATTVFIMEDEPLVAAHIAQIAREIGHDVVGQAVTRDMAVEKCRALRPALLLADVQLADGSSGAEAAEIIAQEMDIPVIFITAFPQKLLSGHTGEPVYLIPKPFRPDIVKAVISQALIQQSAKK